jgi:phage-related baseplate assembly protein
VFTDELRIYDGSLLPVNIEATVVLTRNADASTVKTQVLFAISNVFDIANRNMGQEFNRSDLIYAIKNIDGVKTVDLYTPVDDYPALRKIVTKSERAAGVQGVGVNELIVLGSQNVQFYLEQGNINV